MRVFLTGATGFVGTHLRRRFVADGHRVTGLARHAGPDEPGVEWLRGDVTEPGEWTRAVAGHDAVVHLVAIRRGPRKRFRAVVVDGTRNVVEAAQRAGARRFLLMSANGAAHGDNAYADAKAGAEDAVRASGLPFAIFRPSFIFGEPPRDERGRATSRDFFLEMSGILRKTPVFPIFGRGDYLVAPVAAADVALAFSRALVDDAVLGRAWHLCGAETLTYEETIRRLAGWMGKRRWMPHVPVGLVRFGAAALGWIPGFPITTTELDLLVRGNTCPDDSWRRAFGIEKPTPLADVVPRYV